MAPKAAPRRGGDGVRRLLLREHHESGPVALTPVQRDALLDHPARIGCRPAPGAEGLYHLRPCEMVGVLGLPGLDVVVRPKLGISRALFLLRYALDLPELHDDPAGAGEADLLEAVALLFDVALRRAFRRGVLQGYRVEEDGLLTLRGRLRIGEQIRVHQGRFPPVEVRFDEFGEDVLENRIIKAALLRLSRMRLRHAGLRRSLRHHLERLERVRRVEFGARGIPEPPSNRLNRHYAPALDLARTILEGSAPDLTAGGLQVSGFLVDMNRLFETFLARGLREELGLEARRFPQGGGRVPIHLDRGRRILLKPDLSWWYESRCVWVGDAKYKALGPGDVPRPGDAYQMLAYLVALDLQCGTLVYSSPESGHDEFTIRNLGRTIKVVRFGLGGSDATLLAGLRALAGQVRKEITLQPDLQCSSSLIP